jgi:hypothetical protein
MALVRARNRKRDFVRMLLVFATITVIVVGGALLRQAKAEPSTDLCTVVHPESGECLVHESDLEDPGSPSCPQSEVGSAQC